MKYRQIALFVAAMSLVSCLKSELPGSECDITRAAVSLTDWSSVFLNPTDTVAAVNGDYASSNIVFTNVHLNADLTALAPKFEITPGAKIEPASGSVQDFSKGPMKYTVTSEDGKFTRTYSVSFAVPKSFTSFDFENYWIYTPKTGDEDEDPDFEQPQLEGYYVWSDLDKSQEPNWASANGAYSLLKMMGVQGDFPTMPDKNGYDGACVKLTTCSTGSMGAMFGKPLAAGNFYLGSFDLSNSIMDPLGSTKFGQPFDKEPVRFTGYYKYKAGPQMTDDKNKPVDGKDEGSIYAILYKNHDEKGEKFQLDGKSIEDSPLIVAKAELPQVTDTEDWTVFDVPFVYTGTIDAEVLAKQGYSLTIVNSSSKNGATFLGAVGSTLWIDKYAIVTEKLF